MLTNPANARPLPAFSNPLSFSNDLSERLAADKDFQELTMSVYRLTSVINQKKYFTLMKKLFEGKISADEQTDLLQVFGFSAKEELTLFFKGYLENKEKVHVQFPELQRWDAVKNQVFVAYAEVLKTKNVLNPTPGECWAYWLSCNALCMSYCMLDPDWQGCMWWCQGLCLAEYGICWGMIE